MEDRPINLTLPLSTCQTIINILGELPTKSGVFSILMDIKNQAEAQLAPTAKNESE